MALLSRREGRPSPARREMERMFDELGRWSWPSWMEEEERLTMPALEIGESDDEVLVRAQVPGLKKEDVQVELSDGELVIKGEAKEEKEEKKRSYYRKEFSYGQFARRISLPSGVDTSKASAELRDGVLSVHIPKTEEGKSRSVKLNVK